MKGVQDNRLAILDYGSIETSRPVQIDDKEFVLHETGEAGKARLNVRLQGESILFSSLDRDKGNLRFIKNKKTADHLIIEHSEGAWKVHIVEFKKSVGGDTWSDMKRQFFGGLIKAFQFCGILGISFNKDDIYVYSAYYRDRFQEKDSLIDARVKLHRKSMGILEEWVGDNTCVTVSDGFTARHRKIKMDLDEKGCMIGSLSL